MFIWFDLTILKHNTTTRGHNAFINQWHNCISFFGPLVNTSKLNIYTRFITLKQIRSLVKLMVATSQYSYHIVFVVHWYLFCFFIGSLLSCSLSLAFSPIVTKKGLFFSNLYSDSIIILSETIECFGHKERLCWHHAHKCRSQQDICF